MNVTTRPRLTEYERRELIRIRAQTYLNAGYLIARDDPRGIALVKLRPAFNPLVLLFLGPLALLSLFSIAIAGCSSPRPAPAS